MKAAIDIDGTLAARPDVLAPLTHALASSGWIVVLLTGCLSPDPAAADRAALLEGRRRQVAPFKATFQDIIVCVGRDVSEVAALKASYCLAGGVNLFVDDSHEYCRAVRSASPDTLVLRVEP